jgi:hypothetical protein
VRGVLAHSYADRTTTSTRRLYDLCEGETRDGLVPGLSVDF